MPRYEMRTYKVSPMNVRSIEAASSGKAFQQFAAEVKRLMAAGQVAKVNEAERFLVELIEEGDRKIGSVSIPQTNCDSPRDIRQSP